jgi:hypothetical protein
MTVLPLAFLVTIRLYDTFGMPPADLRTAMRTAETTLRSGSIYTAWVVCPPPKPVPAGNSSGCTGVPQESDLLVRIVRAPQDSVPTDRLGFAAVDTAASRGRLATVFPERVARLAAQSRLPDGTLVGYAIAHEVGHLLLGASHAPRGLMRSRWTIAEMNRRLPTDWRFSREEAARMSSAALQIATAVEAPQQAARTDRSTPSLAPETAPEPLVIDLSGARSSTPPLTPLAMPTTAALRAR